MFRYKPRYKYCFKNKQNFLIYFNTQRLNKKKWFKKIETFEQKPERLKNLYKKRLINKQNLKIFYGGIKESTLKKQFFKILKKNNNNLKLFIINLESRLDIIVLRLNFAKTIYEAKQLIKHKHICINNKIISNSNYILKKGDIITNLKKKKLFYFKKIPLYLEKNIKLKQGVFIRKPLLNEIEYPFQINLNLIYEYYKKYS